MVGKWKLVAAVPIGGDPEAFCVCGHHEMNHASYLNMPHSCNQTSCGCNEYQPARPSEPEAGKAGESVELFWEDPAFPLPFVKAGFEMHMNTYVRASDYYEMLEQFHTALKRAASLEEEVAREKSRADRAETVIREAYAEASAGFPTLAEERLAASLESGEAK